MSATVTIGTWNETESRSIDRCPSYYAADHEAVQTEVGTYPLRLIFHAGYLVPMPYWLITAIPAKRTSGALYSGFGGVNYSRTELPIGEAVQHTLQMHTYNVKALVESGRVTLRPGFEWLLEEIPWKAAGAPSTWAEVAVLEKSA